MMTEQESSLLQLAEFLDQQGISYVVIGGLAVAVWGEARATLDIDSSIWVPDDRIEAFIDEARRHFEILVEEPLAFVEETSVLPLRSSKGVRIDLIFARLPFEQEAIERGTKVTTGEGSARFCTAEDLILMKILSERERDLSDARGVALLQMENLDLAYLEPRIRELAELLEQPAIFRRWQTWVEEADGLA